MNRIHILVEKGNCALVKHILKTEKKNASELMLHPVSFGDIGLCTILHVALMNRDLKMVELIVHDSIELDPSVFGPIVSRLLRWKSSESEQTPLHIALSNFNRKDGVDEARESLIVTLLLRAVQILFEKEQQDILLNTRDSSGNSPLLTAISSNAPIHIVELMINAGCNINKKDNDGLNALHLAVIHNNYELCEVILKYMQKMDELQEKITIYDRDLIHDYNALHYAALVGNAKIAKLLIESPLNDVPLFLSYIKSKEGEFPYSIAVMRNHMDVATIIKESLPSDVLEDINKQSQKEEREESQQVLLPSEAQSKTDTVSNEKIASYLSSVSYLYQKFVRLGSNSAEIQDINETKDSLLKSHIKKPLIDIENHNIMGYVKSLGYPIEKHKVMTDDGFVINMYRIPHGKPTDLLGLPRINPDSSQSPTKVKRPVVFLQHGIFNSSSTWLVTGEKQALAFILAMAGFDVWMGNNRGTHFGRNHRVYNVTHREYWQFSWDHMAKYDLPAQINYVLETTKASTLSFIGHSQGTSQAFAAFSNNPDLQSKINLFIALAPVVCLKNQTSHLFRILSLLKGENLITMLGIGEIGQVQLTRSILPKLANGLAGRIGMIKLGSIFMDCDIDHEVLPILTQYEPSSTSAQNLAHWSQLVRSGTFSAFDYGKAENLKVYGQETPPVYNLKNIKIPVAVFYGELDYLANPTDIESFLLQELPNVIFSLKVENFKHNDFVWGKTAWEKVYAHIIDLLMLINSRKEKCPVSICDIPQEQFP
jgi:pimeloyl-ACP methyl ester carboxylesterase/ankyrin repeat protein